jgi:hypothetical protein
MNLAHALSRETNFAFTDNGALTNASSLSKVLDFFALGSAMRTRDEDDIWNLFMKALEENSTFALRALFYSRDPRGGQGERRAFRAVLRRMANHYAMRVWLQNNLKLVAEYGRWDDLWVLLGVDETLDNIIASLVLVQLENDLNNVDGGGSVSLLAKWMPSENASSKVTKKQARLLRERMFMTPRQYRKVLSTLRAYLNVVETKMCAGEWDDIDYAAVPSKAHMNYRKAFGKHDPFGYASYLGRVEKGEEKINSGVLYPYEIFNKVLTSYGEDKTLEAQWAALPNYLEGENADRNVLVMADVSGSMSGAPISVSVSLALYCAERSKGIFHNKFLTFSERPELVEVSGMTLRERMRNIQTSNWGMTTDLIKAFDLVLATAVKYRVRESEMPDMILIVSDMQFNKACRGNMATNLEVIKHNYAAAGYVAPQLVFWNVDAKNDTSPAKFDDRGVFLVSGCSPSILKSALNSTAVTPIDMMIDVLTQDRYSSINAV